MRIPVDRFSAHGNIPVRTAHDPLEGCAEGAFGSVAERRGNHGNGIVGHGDGDHGFIPIVISSAREKGVSAFVGEGHNRWPAVHRFDAAHLYRLVLEKGVPGGRYHGVAEEGVPFREIASVIGCRLNVPVVSKAPEEAANHFGWFAHFAAMDIPPRVNERENSWGGSQSSPGCFPISTARSISKPERKTIGKDPQETIDKGKTIGNDRQGSSAIDKGQNYNP